ncbi:MAG: FAD-dependent oxidoreductase [Chthoniobacterales bacterium]
MPTRREFLRGGLSAFALGMAGRTGLADPPGSRSLRQCAPSGGLAVHGTSPFREIPADPPTVMVDGLPFAEWFSGDDFENASIPFHSIPDYFNGGLPPEPAEEVDVAIVGGGLSGLASAYFLRQHNTVLFELHDRFGGNAQGEVWRDVDYSLGSAYFITPDKGSFLERFYHELGLHRLIRTSASPDPMELNGVIHDDFWSGSQPWASLHEQEAFRRYAKVVTNVWENEYPEIPLSKDPVEAARVRALDMINFRQDLEQRMGMPLTPLLAAGVQSYFFSSFNAPMEEISAASGWNFVAAEEGGRWVLPGGNSRFVHELWKRLKEREGRVRPECRPHFLRCRCRVIDVRPQGERLQVTYFDAAQSLRSISARFVVMACSKHIAKHALFDLEHWDPEKLDAMQQIDTYPYLVANVLLHAPIERDFYDCFLLGDGVSYPMSGGALEQNPIVTDMLRGDYTRERGARSVLTLYWPLSWPAARFTLLLNEPWQHYTQLLVPQLRRMLTLLDVPESAVKQVRLTRWGHAMPIARPGLIANGIAETAHRPTGNNLFFVNQDNWALPAVENSLLDAKSVTDTIRGLL